MAVDFGPEILKVARLKGDYWTRTGNLPNSDARGRVVIGETTCWLLFEAKSQVGELHSS